MECIVGQHAFPNQIPERGNSFTRVSVAAGIVKRRKKQRTGFFERCHDGLLPLGEVQRRRRTPEARDVIRQIDRDATVAFAHRFDAAPDDFAGAGQRVEIGGCVALDARRQSLRLED